MVKVLKLLIEHGYLGAEMKRMAGHASMPESVKQMLREIGMDVPEAGHDRAAG
jgi:hypothetical protein